MTMIFFLSPKHCVTSLKGPNIWTLRLEHLLYKIALLSKRMDLREVGVKEKQGFCHMSKRVESQVMAIEKR